MSQAATDTWYIRFPDGRVVRAANTGLVRQQLGAGRIPGNSTVRRHPDEEWQSLEWTKEFADLATGSGTHEPLPATNDHPEPRPRRKPKEGPATVASRLDPNQLQTIGVSQAMHELVAALDSTLVQRKLIVAIAVGLSLGVLLGFPGVAGFDSGTKAGQVSRWVVAAGAWVITSLACALLTQMTYIEVSRLRPARWGEALEGNTGRTIRVALVHLVVIGGAIALISFLRRAPDMLEPAEDLGAGGLQHLFATWAVILSLVLEIGIWPVFGLALLLAPILIVENCSIWKALRQWLALMQEDLGRAFLYEALALGLGLVVAFPLVAPLVGTAHLFPGGRLEFAATFTRIVLGCLVLAPVAAYLIVANMFIYLNLRYEAGGQRR